MALREVELVANSGVFVTSEELTQMILDRHVKNAPTSSDQFPDFLKRGVQKLFSNDSEKLKSLIAG